MIDRKANYKYYPAGNTREKYLAAGLVYCKACGTRCNIVSSNNGKKKDGSPKKYIFYQCSNVPNIPHDDCFHRGSARLIDQKIWDKVWPFVSNPDAFIEALEKRIKVAQEQEGNAKEDYTQYERDFEELLLKRQQVINWALEKKISEADLETQLATITEKQDTLQIKMTETRLRMGNRAEQLMELANQFRNRFGLGWEGLNIKPRTPEEAEKQFKARRRIVQAIVDSVDIDKSKDVEVNVDIDLRDPEESPEKVCISDPTLCHC